MAPQDSATDAGGERTGERGRDACLRSRILEVATRLFAERGWRGTNVQDVVRDAGCTKPALYYHFDSKEALFVETVHAQLRVLAERHVAAHSDVETVRDRLVGGVRMVLELLRDEPYAMRLLYRAHLQPDEGQPDAGLDEFREAQVAQMRAVVEEGIRVRELRPDLDPDLASDVIAGTMDLQLRKSFAAGSSPPIEFADQIIDSLLRGFAP